MYKLTTDILTIRVGVVLCGCLLFKTDAKKSVDVRVRSRAFDAKQICHAKRKKMYKESTKTSLIIKTSIMINQNA